MKKTSHIPIHSLEQRGKSSFGISKIEQGKTTFNNYPPEVEHRDDYYVFLYQESGNSKITVDFQDITLSGSTVFCIQPGQVHFGTIGQDTSGWAISVDPEWVPAEFRLFLMETHIAARPVQVDDQELIFRNALHLLLDLEKQRALYPEQVLKSMVDVCLHLFIPFFKQTSGEDVKQNLRTELITRQFRSLLLTNFRILKSPSAYATSLNITPAYLNEVVKDTTGYPVSYWIHQEIILEAKRSLFYTTNSVKEIAFSLGYSDPAYFIRLFKKTVGISPLQFRNKYPK